MHFSTFSRRTLACLACLGASGQVARALVSLNDGKDKVFVTASASMGYDSNIYANKGGDGDYVASTSLSAEYSRRAGLIGVDLTVGVSANFFQENTSQNFQNPNFNLEFTKQTGRTTGSLLLSAQRQSKADSASNMRNESWNYGANLNLRYPVIERYSLSGGVGVNKSQYVGNENLVDQISYSANTDLFYVYTSERDLIAGYRVRRERSSMSTFNTDHAVYVGLSGRILPKLNGTVRVGAQLRDSSGPRSEQFTSWMASASTTWNIMRRLSATGTVSKDFSTTSTNITTDSLSASTSLSYALTSRWSFGFSGGIGQTDFLGIDGEGRSDFFVSAGFDISYALNDHFKASLGYAYMCNWSSFATADFERNSFSLSLSSRW